MNVKVFPEITGGIIDAIPSKSHAHRMLILAAFADAPTDLICRGSSDDIDITSGCLKKLGAEITRKDDTLHIVPAGKIPSEAELDCGESGSTYRFMVPVCAALGIKATFVLHGRLPERPMGPLFDLLSGAGISINRDNPSKVMISGRLTGNGFSVRGDISSQFITGLMLASAVSKKDICIDISGGLSSSGYVNITGMALNAFSIFSGISEKRIDVAGSTGIRSPEKAFIEGDWSNAAFMMAMCAAGRKALAVRGLSMQSSQGDRQILKVLRDFGCEVTEGNNEVVISVHSLKAANVDAADIPDLVPAIAALACAAEGRSVITNVSRLRLKESDRIRSVTEGLASLGADIEADDNRIIINGTGSLAGGAVDSYRDHRIVMMAAAAAPLCSKPVVISNAESVDKSYPGFFSDAGTLGLRYSPEEI